MNRSEIMRRIKSRNTKPELFVRRLIHAMGLRYRLHVKNLPGKPDIVFYRKKKIIFVHGCFWHIHEGCINFRVPKSNSEYWIAKQAGNRRRDIDNQTKLKELGWSIKIIWECQLKDAEKLQREIFEFLNLNGFISKL